MAYTPPVANAVDLRFPSGAYTAPAANSVVLQFPSEDPVAFIAGTSTCAFNLVAITPSETSISGAAATGFVSGADKFSTFLVGAATTFVPVQYNPQLIVTAGATMAFTGGGIVSSDASVAGATTTNFERYYETPIVCATTFTPVAGGIVSDRFQGVAKASGTFCAVYQAPSRFTLLGKGACSFASRSYVEATFGSSSAATSKFSGASIHSGVVSISGAASSVSSGRKLVLSEFSSSGQTTTGYSGAPATPAVFHSSGVSAAIFGGAYSSVPVSVVPVGADVLYVLARNKQVFSHAV